jgi:1-acyl-sn-glycerol-3-phosphate acyltransferase
MHREAGPERLITAILDFFGGQDLLSREAIRAALEQEIDAAGAQAVVELKARVTADHGWGYYAPDPLARRIHHRLADRFLSAESELSGAHHLVDTRQRPLVIVANHLSYADANVVEMLLYRAGLDSVADRLTAIAGPKVFTNRTRRFSSLCFGTIKVPQSADVSSEDAVLGARDVARAARQAIDAARERLAAGDALLLFAEGTRSRSAAMQPMLAGAARYLDLADGWVAPVGLEGPEALFPVEDAVLHPARVTMRIGQPWRARDLVRHADEDRRTVMDAVGLAIAELVSVPYRGAYAHAADYREAGAALRATRQQ